MAPTQQWNCIFRVITWNLCDNFSTKTIHIQRLRPDIAILQEVRRDSLRNVSLSNEPLWIGVPGKKGMAVLPFGGWKVSLADTSVPERWFLPFHASNDDRQLRCIAVWAPPNRDAGPQTIKALDGLRTFIQSGPCVIVGDFNHSVAFDHRFGPNRQFAEVLRTLRAYGMSSSWHEKHAEQHGKESRPTFYWRRKLQDPFHIDFAFHSAALNVRNAELGGYEQYVATGTSDHVPLGIDYELMF